MRGSPPVSITHSTPSLRKSPMSLEMSASEIDVPLRLAFQMSHMIQRQLHRLCGMSAITGTRRRRCVIAFHFRSMDRAMVTASEAGNFRTVVRKQLVDHLQLDRKIIELGCVAPGRGGAER